MFLFENNIPDNKRLDISLKTCLGFGLTSSSFLFSKMGLNLKQGKFQFLNKRFINNLDFLLNLKTINLIKLCVGVERKNRILFEFKRVKESRTYRALRHYQRLPVRGQRTKTNARTQKSKRGFRKALPIPGKKKKI